MSDLLDRRALIVLGMHRSGTSALTGLLAEMGCSLPRDLMAPSEQNEKGFFESDKITGLNEDLLNSCGMKWSDLNRFPDSWHTSSKAAEFRKRAIIAVQEEFGDAGLIALKDPRHCRLVPFWEDVLTELAISPYYVCIHRHPAEVAASVMRRGGFEPHYGQMLWLRHVLDAELATRGKSRVFVSYDQVMSDWRTVVGRIATELDLSFPRSVEEATDSVQRFLSADLKHFSSDELTTPWLSETSDWFAVTLEVLDNWSRAGETASDHGTLDRVRIAMEAASDTLVALSNELLARHMEVRGLQNSRQGSELSLRSRLEQQSVDLAETRKALARSEAAAVEQGATLKATLLENKTLQQNLEKRTDDLHQARRRPIQGFMKYIEFKTLRALHSKGYPLTQKVLARHPYLDPASIPGGAKALNTSGVLSKPGHIPYRQDLPTAIIVTHEASRTGAPILALNLARSLSAQLNIVSVILREGELVSEFQQASTAVYLVEAGRGNLTPFNNLLDDITARLPPAFAIVNSIVSRHILDALRTYKVPSVALLHEFASYTRPSNAFRDTFELADEIVFSCDLTMQNAIEETEFDMNPSHFHVLAQGRCAVPVSEENGDQRQEERSRLTARLRPHGVDAGEFLVIGAGTVLYRKGVDLFIDVARRVLSTESGQNARFAWIGSGFDNERDAAYSVYLQDQINRANLADRMIMLPATSEIEHVYELSNVLLLTSRLDPLPNVAIDALSEGVPVICFDKTTGIADLLTNAGLGDACVAGYLDTADAAKKVLELMRSQETYTHICERSKAFAASAFDFDLYAAKIKELGLGAGKPEADD